LKTRSSKKKRISKKRLRANRANGDLGEGPKTSEGKAKVRYNALKHGILAKSAILPGSCSDERPEDLEFIISQLIEDLEPVGILEHTLVEDIGTITWRLRRVLKAEVGNISRNLAETQEIEASVLEADTYRPRFGGDLSSVHKYGDEIRTYKGIVEALRQAESDVINEGEFSQDSQQFFEGMARIREGRVVGKEILRLARFVKKGDSLLEQEPEEYKDVPDTDTCKSMLLEKLGLVIKIHEIRVQTAIGIEKERFIVDKAIQNVPTDKASINVQRYETMLVRRMDKKIDQVQKLQDRRRKNP